MKKVTSFILFFILFFTFPVFPFDKEAGKFIEFSEPDKYVDLSTSIVDVSIVGKATGIYTEWIKGKAVNKKYIGSFGQSGVGFILGDYIITAYHVVVPTLVSIQIDKSIFLITKIVEIKESTIHIGKYLGEGGTKATIYHLDQASDLAILKFDKSWIPAKSLPYFSTSTIEYDKYYIRTDKVEKGDIVATIVRARTEDGSKDWFYEVRYGKVIANKPIHPTGDPDKLSWFAPTDITLDLTIYPGDSGSPLFAFVNGEPVIIGVVRAIGWCSTSGLIYSYAARIDWINYVIGAE